jgi:hypothetical protein
VRGRDNLGSEPTTLCRYDALVESKEGGGVWVEHRVWRQDVLHEIWPTKDVSELNSL